MTPFEHAALLPRPGLALIAAPDRAELDPTGVTRSQAVAADGPDLAHGGDALHGDGTDRSTLCRRMDVGRKGGRQSRRVTGIADRAGEQAIRRCQPAVGAGTVGHLSPRLSCVLLPQSVDVRLRGSWVQFRIPEGSLDDRSIRSLQLEPVGIHHLYGADLHLVDHEVGILPGHRKGSYAISKAGEHRCPPWCHRCPDLRGDVLPGCMGTAGLARDGRDLSRCTCPRNSTEIREALKAARERVTQLEDMLRQSDASD